MSDALNGASSSVEYVHFTRGASYLIIQSLGVNAVTVVAFVVLARLITPKDMGVWAILQLLNAACVTFVTWFPSAVTKFVAENTSRGMRSVAAAAFYQGMRANVVLYLPVVIGFYMGATFLSSHLLGDVSYAPLFRVFALDVFLSAGVIPTVTAALLGLRMFRESAIVGLIAGGFVRQILIISLVILMRNLLGLVIGWLVSDMISVGVYLAIAVHALGGPRFDFPLSTLFHFYLPLEFAQIVGFAQTWFDRALLIALVPLATLGIYNAAVTAYAVLSNVSIALTKMLFPAFSSIRGNTKTRNGLPAAICLATRYSCFIVIPLDLLLLATAKPAIALFIGERYVNGFLPLAILCAVDALTVFATAVTPALMAVEETTVISAAISVAVPVGLATAYLLLPSWGITGAATGRVVVILLIAIVQTLALRRKISLQLDLRTVARILIAGTIMSALVAAVQLLWYSKFLLPVYGLIGAAVYIVMLRFLRIVNSGDLDLLQRFLGRRLSIVNSILRWMLLA